MQKRKLTKEQTLQKLRHYCRYQERCRSEVKNKLYELGVNKNEYEEMIIQLTGENYLDEERFAVDFAEGKFKIKRWGRKKIQYELKEKRVNDEAIQKALKQIDESDYMHVLQKLAKEKYTSLKHEQYLIRKKKAMDYLMQKGYEIELIKIVIEKITN